MWLSVFGLHVPVLLSLLLLVIPVFRVDIVGISSLESDVIVKLRSVNGWVVNVVVLLLLFS